MFGKKCIGCEVKVGGLFGKKNTGTEERPLCSSCFEAEAAKEKAEKGQREKGQREKEQREKEQREKEQREKEQREAEPQIRKLNELNTKNPDKVMDIDGNVYTTVKIGKQIWTVDNLKTTKYNDGTAIPLVSDGGTWNSYDCNGKSAYCWYDNDKSKNEKYGALYNWYAVDTGKLAPKGWHVPTEDDWTALEEYLVANGYNWDGTTDTTKKNKIAKALAAKTDWIWCNDSGAPGNDLSKNNPSGFSALPGGYRNREGDYGRQGLNGEWWRSATERETYSNTIFGRGLGCGNENLRVSYSDDKGCGFSVRLVRDN